MEFITIILKSKDAEQIFAVGCSDRFFRCSFLSQTWLWSLPFPCGSGSLWCEPHRHLLLAILRQHPRLFVASCPSYVQVHQTRLPFKGLLNITYCLWSRFKAFKEEDIPAVHSLLRSYKECDGNLHVLRLSLPQRLCCCRSWFAWLGYGILE